MSLSISFPDTSSYLIVNSDNNELSLSNNDFTIQWWQYQTESHGFSIPFSIRHFITFICLSFNNILILNDINNKFDQRVISNNVWDLFTLCRQSNVIYLYKNGNFFGNFVYTDAINSNSTPLYICNEDPPSINKNFVGYIYDFLWINGYSLYSSNSSFDPFAEPDLSNIGSGQIILRLKGSNYSGTLANSINAIGNVTISTNIPNIACYSSLSKVLCFIDNGEKYVDIKDLQKNTFVKTYLDGYIKIKDVLKFKRSNYNCFLNKMFKLKKNKIQNNIPFDDLIVTAGHSILVDELSNEEKIKQSKFWDKEYKIHDKYLLLSNASDLFEECINYNEEYLYHIFINRKYF